MFKSFWDSQEQQTQPRPRHSTESWYPPGVNSPSSSDPSTPRSSASSSFNLQRPSERQQLSHVSPTEAAVIISLLKDKSVGELRKLLSDKDVYNSLLLSLEPVKTQNMVRDELRNETVQLARENLERETRIMELRNQCRIIRTTELAAASEQLNDQERQKEKTLKFYSLASLLQQLQEAMNKTEEESEVLHRQLLDKEIDLAYFMQKYKMLRSIHHKRTLTYLAAKSSMAAFLM